MKAVILAGGMGTRLWPMSRQSRPKQFFDVVGKEPLIRDTYHRLQKWFPEEKIYFAISPAYETLLKEHFPEVTENRIIIEPAKRDTGPAMGYAAAMLEIDDPFYISLKMKKIHINQKLLEIHHLFGKVKIQEKKKV